MGDEAKEVHDRSSSEIEQMTGKINGCSRDLLKRFKPGSNQHLFHHHSTRSSESVAAGATGQNDDEEIGLNLGLSLGGCFGVNPRGNTNNNNNNNSSSSSLRRSSSTNINIININNNNNNNNNNYYDHNSNNRIVRSSSSFAGLTTLLRDEDSVVGQQQQQKQQQQPATLCSSSLMRTSSLPMETEEEWRKRKELQSLRRMEAKRKRSEKQQQKYMNMNMIGGCGGKDGKDRASSLEQSCEEDKRVVEVALENHHRSTSSKQQQQQQGFGAAAFGLSSWAAALVHGMDSSTVNNGKANNVGSGGGSQPRPQGSLGSQGSTSGISESLQGMSNCTESRSPSSVQSLPEQKIEHKPTIVLPKRMPEKSSASARTKGEDQAKKIPKILENGVVEETGMKVMEEMPCVSTKGDGPNGKRIEGFLYKYRKGEEVRIVCVCHGNFLSPAEFVKHAGGGDVAHPLRHIVVNPSPSFL